MWIPIYFSPCLHLKAVVASEARGGSRVAVGCRRAIESALGTLGAPLPVVCGDAGAPLPPQLLGPQLSGPHSQGAPRPKLSLLLNPTEVLGRFMPIVFFPQQIHLLMIYSLHRAILGFNDPHPDLHPIS